MMVYLDCSKVKVIG